MEKWLGTFDSLGQTFDSSGESFASLRMEKQLSPSESKVCPLLAKVCLTIFPSMASIFHVVGTYIPFLLSDAKNRKLGWRPRVRMNQGHASISSDGSLTKHCIMSSC